MGQWPGAASDGAGPGGAAARHCRTARRSSLLIQTHHTLWTTLFHLGELTTARAHLEQGQAPYSREQHHTAALHYGVDDPGVCCLGCQAHILWLLGYPEQALRHADVALTLARALDHPFTLAYALIDVAVLHQLRQDVRRVHAQAEAALSLSTTYGFENLAARSVILRGWALTAPGHPEGFPEMLRGLEALRKTGTERRQPWYRALLVEAYGQAGQCEAGLAVVAEVLAVTHSTGECTIAAELYRLKGELLLGQQDTKLQARGTKHTWAEAEDCFRHAVAIARQQQAKAWELRAALSLSRLWHQQGKRDAAYQVLAEVYGWFTEGFDTPDLQQARAMLITLEQHSRHFTL